MLNITTKTENPSSDAEAAQEVDPRQKGGDQPTGPDSGA